MSDNTFALEIDSIILYKFGSLVSGLGKADKNTSIDISLQVQEVSVFESIHRQSLKCEIAVVDQVGLLFNFPISGEEAVVINYRNVKDNITSTLYMIIDSVSDISTADDARSMAYVINCTSIESYANSKQTVQQAYHDTSPNIVKNIFDQHIVQRIKRVFPEYIPQTLFVENNDVQQSTVVIPNLHPFAAFSMLALMSGEFKNRFTYLMYQTIKSYNFRTVQSMIDPNAVNQRRKAFNLKYMYLSNQISDKSSKMNNDGRVVQKLTVNKRLSSFQKLSAGYYHNNLFEINIAQKAVWGQPTRTEEIPTIYDNQLNTVTYSQLACIEGDEEQSNRTRYVVNTQRENDDQFPVSKMRLKWGKDIIASNAMAQIDLTVTVPGTSEFVAGDLIYIEIPEMHGFNNTEEDDLISGYFLITELKHILRQGGFHTTVFGLNRDSYNSSIERDSKYV